MSEDENKPHNADDKFAAAFEEAVAAVNKNRPEGISTPPRPVREEAPSAPAPEGGEGQDKLQSEAESWKQRAYRSAAELENFRKRTAKEKADLRKYGAEEIVKDIIPVADNLERAIAAASEAEGGLARGVGMVLNQLVQILGRHGATSFEALGEAFDPERHEAMSQVPWGDAEPGSVVEVFQRGWRLHERLVRPAMVIIAAAPPPVDPTGEPGDA